MSTYKKLLEGFQIWCQPGYRFLTVETWLCVFGESNGERYYTQLEKLDEVQAVHLNGVTGDLLFSARRQ